MSITLRTTLVLVAAFCAVVGPIEYARPAGPPVRVELTLDKDKYEVGEPIHVKMRLTNTGESVIRMVESSDDIGWSDDYSFVVWDEAGKALEDPLAVNGTGGTGAIGPYDLEPGKSFIRTLTLNYWMRPPKPGKYLVRGYFELKGAAGDDKVESPGVPLRIVETRPAAVEARVKRLVAELDNGGDPARIAPLLGFTGHDAAIAPLVDLLYATEARARYYLPDHWLRLLDGERVKKALFESVKTRGPRQPLVYLLIYHCGASARELTPILLKSFDDRYADVRVAAIQGVGILNDGQSDPRLFPPLAARLKDTFPAARCAAISAVGCYKDAAALKALKPLVNDAEPFVCRLATTAIGGVAEAAEAGSSLRQEAVETLKAVRQAGGYAAGDAERILRQIGEK